jgi:hypothetical protein
MTIQTVRADYKNGAPITMRDITTVPVKRHGSWPVADMLNLSSVTALWTAYKRAESAQEARTTVTKRPEQQQRFNRA